MVARDTSRRAFTGQSRLILPSEFLDGLQAAERKKIQKVVPIDTAIFDQFLGQ
jgi:hypothetical protein